MSHGREAMALVFRVFDVHSVENESIAKGISYAVGGIGRGSISGYEGYGYVAGCAGPSVPAGRHWER